MVGAGLSSYPFVLVKKEAVEVVSELEVDDEDEPSVDLDPQTLVPTSYHIEVAGNKYELKKVQNQDYYEVTIPITGEEVTEDEDGNKTANEWIGVRGEAKIRFQFDSDGKASGKVIDSKKCVVMPEIPGLFSLPAADVTEYLPQVNPRTGETGAGRSVVTTYKKKDETNQE